MRTLSSSVIRTVEIELAEDEIADMVAARSNLREFLQQTVSVGALDRKAMETAIYLMSTVLGNHQ